MATPSWCHRCTRFGRYLALLICLALCTACGSKSASVVAEPVPLSSQTAVSQADTPPSPEARTATDAGLQASATDTDVWDDELEDDWETDYDELDDEALMEAEDPASTIADPLEPFNRAMFVVNDKLYFWILKPTANVYAAVFPQQMRTGIYNVFHNLAFPIRFVSSVLQLKLDKAAREVGAFAMNTTFGIGGLVKVSDHIEPLQDISPEDMGQTLAHYGIGDGFYIVWPVFGPSTLRDTTGKIGEYFLDPINYIDEWEIRWAIKGADTLNYTSLHLGEYEDLKEAAFDPYEALKDFYLQYRRHLVRE
ncbi:MlaA family lipoprotein [Desulfoplanes formicivorans]|nr:VacJ family lipoprotein [Desulfoplanes formicivorans]